MRPALLDPLFAPLSSLPGIGPKLGDLYARLFGQESIEDCRVVDLVFHFPHSIVDRRNQPGRKVRAALMAGLLSRFPQRSGCPAWLSS